MNDQDKTREQLIAELGEMRQRETDQQRRLARSQQRETDQRQINNSLPVLIATAGLDGYYKEVNPAFERLLGWSEQESLSRPFFEFIHPDDHAAATERFGRLESGEPITDFVDRNICKDGSYRWINWTVIPVPNRGVIFGIGHDITDRKQAETALRASEAKYRRLYQSIRDGVVTVNMDGRIQQFNEAYCQMLGYSPDELLALTYQDLTPSRWHSFEAAIVRDQVVSRKYSNTYEKEYRRQDGTIFPVELRTYLITDENGQPAAMWGIVRDITERKQAEAALRQARDELEQRVKERTAELRESNALLQAEVKQRRAAEEQLRASQERFELAVRGVGVGIWDWDIRTGIVYYSPLPVPGEYLIVDGSGRLIVCNEVNDAEDYRRLLFIEDRPGGGAAPAMGGYGDTMGYPGSYPTYGSGS